MEVLPISQCPKEIELSSFQKGYFKFVSIHGWEHRLWSSEPSQEELDEWVKEIDATRAKAEARRSESSKHYHRSKVRQQSDGSIGWFNGD